MGKLPQISDYVDIMSTPRLLKAPILKNGHVIRNNNDIVIRYTGGFCVVFPFQTSTKKYAVRCWYTNLADAQERTRRISNELKQINLPYFVGFEYLPDALATSEGLQPVVIMDWIDAKPLKEYINNHIYNSIKIRLLADKFLKMVKELHLHNLSHGDLQHGNILVKEDGNLVLVDYDSMYVSTLNGFTDEIKGLKGYQHESRWSNVMLSPKADYFSELIIYTSLIALSKYPKLWLELNMKDTETLLFTADDIKLKGKSCIFNKLDKDKELKLLSNALKGAMRCNNIEDLQPLEMVLKSPLDDISIKWNANVYKTNTPDNNCTINHISKSWSITHPEPMKLPDLNKIIKKW